MDFNKKYEVDYVLPELEKLNRFFKDSIEDERPNVVHGSFGQASTFFGNVIQYCRFDIPASAMKLIYEFNKEHIECTIERLNKLKCEKDFKENLKNNRGVV